MDSASNNDNSTDNSINFQLTDLSKQTSISNSNVWVHIFQNDLRLLYNDCLLQAIEKAKGMRMIFVFLYNDKPWKYSMNRARFALESAAELNEKLNGKLLWFHCSEEECLERLSSIEEFKIKGLSFSKSPAHCFTKQNEAIKDYCIRMRLPYIEYLSHSIFKNTEALQEFAKKAASLDRVDFNNLVLEKKLIEETVSCDFAAYPNAKDLLERIRFWDTRGLPENNVPVFEEWFNVSLDRLPKIVNKGGETEGLRRLRVLNVQNHFTKTLLGNSAYPFHDNKAAMSMYITHGCIDPRMFFQKVVSKTFNDVTMGVESNMMLREYYHMLYLSNCMLNNGSELLNQKFAELENPQFVQKFYKATTGFPLADALLRQLMKEGWNVSIARIYIVFFATTSGLNIHWKHGVALFSSCAIDFDYPINVGNWMRYSMIEPAFIDVVQMAKSIDPEGEVIRQFVPELREMPVEFVHEPWRAPIEVQRAARCIVGLNYPEPCFDHKKQHIKNKEFFLKYDH